MRLRFVGSYGDPAGPDVTLTMTSWPGTGYGARVPLWIRVPTATFPVAGHQACRRLGMRLRSRRGGPQPARLSTR